MPNATYNLEGDGPLVLTAYREISTLHSVVANQHYPNVLAIAKKESSSNEQPYSLCQELRYTSI